MKFFNIILGAGFSKAIASLPITQDIDQLIFSQEDKGLFDFYESLEINPKNFETIVHLFQASSECQSLQNYFYPNCVDNKINDFGEKVYNRTVDILEAKLTSWEKKVQISNQFIEFLEVLINKQEFKINIFDLNFDNVFEAAIKDSRLNESYYDYYDVSLTGFDNKKFFNYPMAELSINPYTWSLENDYYREISYQQATKYHFGFDLNKKTIQGDLKSFKDKKIFHYKLHGSLSEYFGIGDDIKKQLLLFKSRNNIENSKAKRYFITGGNKFKHLKDPHTSLLFRILALYSGCDTLTLGYSFNDLHVEFSANISRGGLSPIQFFCKGRPSKHLDGLLLCKINEITEKNLDNEVFFLKNFLGELELEKIKKTIEAMQQSQ